MCNHLLGYMPDYDFIPLYKETIKDKLNFYCKSNDRMVDEGFAEKKFKPEDYLDNRRGMVAKFNYCPLCGEKINWKKIKQEVISE